jgi:hypothetical protein
MFNNNTGDNGYGIMDTPARPTLLGRYIRNLTSILADNSSASPSRVNCSFSGMPSTGYTMLMQKSNGKYELVIGGKHLPANALHDHHQFRRGLSG